MLWSAVSDSEVIKHPVFGQLVVSSAMNPTKNRLKAGFLRITRQRLGRCVLQLIERTHLQPHSRRLGIKAAFLTVNGSLPKRSLHRNALDVNLQQTRQGEFACALFWDRTQDCVLQGYEDARAAQPRRR
jgi:hypothetical protein